MTENRLTESVNPRTRDIDRLSTEAILRRINEEDHGVADAVRGAIPGIARAVESVCRSLSEGGRLIYIGAGTSGRIGVIDAVECAPTYGMSRDRILAVIAGGNAAMCGAVEQAEDDIAAGGREVAALQVGRHDTIIGLSASGSTPFVSGALQAAKQRGASTVAVICNPEGANLEHADIRICLLTGPEVICGSTRMKAASAQKMAVNMISTAAMVRSGRVMGNFMVEISPNNTKLRQRACFIVGELCGCSLEKARTVLEECQWNLRQAITRQRGQQA